MNNTDTAETTKFLITKEYRKFEEFCNACFREKYIGICYGVPGVGKTMSAMHYAKQNHFDTFDLTSSSNEECLKAAKEIAHCRTVFYTAPVTNSPKKTESGISDARFNMFTTTYEAQRLLNIKEEIEDRDYSLLLIIDEADRLKMNSLEQVRDMYDQRKNWGIVLVGMHGMEKRLARYPQLYSRVGFAHQYKSIGQDEMAFILEHHWSKLGLSLDKKSFVDAESITAIARITNGNFRVIHRLFSQIERIMKVNELTSISKEVVEAARDCLVIGTI